MISDRALRTLLFSLTALLFSPAAAAAQIVRGTVVEDGTMKPLGGAFVVLVDADGERHNGVLAADDGRFFLRVTRPGEYRLVAELIGYGSTETNLIDLQPGGVVEYTLEVPVQAVTLDGISVRAAAQCRVHPGAGPETARLWEEARKVLEVTSWGEEQEALNMRIMQYSRELSPNAHAVREETQRSRTAYYRQSPYVSRPAEELARDGYIQPAGENEFDYFGPDAEVLLSESFLRSHCFRVVESAEEPTLVGLGFEPMRGQDRPDVEGVLWLDRGTAELRRLDFTYSRLPIRGVTSSHAGGRVEFQRLANGSWIVNRWRIRMPVVAERQDAAWRSGGQRVREVIALNEIGAEVQTVTDLSGTVLAEAEGGSLYGLVWDSVIGEPLADATVALDDRGHSTTTGVDGTYRFTGLPSGVYEVRFTHPNLDVLGAEPAPRRVALESGGATRLELAIPAGEQIASVVCAEGEEGQALVYGRVMDSGQVWPVQDAVVRLDPPVGPVRTVTADEDGIFRLCVSPGPRPARVAAFRPGDVTALGSGGEGAASEAELEISGRTAVRQDLTVDIPTRTFSTWSNRITGSVLTRAGRAPIEGVSVTLSDSLGRPITSAMTNAEGTFQIPHPGSGQQFSLLAEHIGFSDARGEVGFGSRDELRVELLMDTRAIELEPIVVVERRRDYLAEMGYYLRKDRGLGKFYERDVIERYRPSLLTDVLRRTPGVQIKGFGRSGDVEMTSAKRAGGFEGSAFYADAEGTGGLKCLPGVFLDGALIRPGGDPEGTYTPLNEIVQPEAIEAIEVYRRISEVPPRYAGQHASCGVIAIWTTR